MKSKLRTLTALTLPVLGLAGCFVDLDRDEAVLRILVDGAGPTAEDIIVEVDDGADLPPFVGRFRLTGAPSQPLPDINIATGMARVTAWTVDENGIEVDARRQRLLDLRLGANGLQLDFSAPMERERTAQDAVAVASAATTLESAPASGGTWRVELPIDQAAWSAAVARMTSDLGGTPSVLRVWHVTVGVEAVPGDEDGLDGLDELWEGTVQVRLEGQGLSAEAGSFQAIDLVQTRLSGVDVDVISWTTLPVYAAIVLTGATPSEEPDLPARVVVELELLGSL